jgi:CarD family transcriptional regulator
MLFAPALQKRVGFQAMSSRHSGDLTAKRSSPTAKGKAPPPGQKSLAPSKSAQNLKSPPKPATVKKLTSALKPKPAENSPAAKPAAPKTPAAAKTPSAAKPEPSVKPAAKPAIKAATAPAKVAASVAVQAPKADEPPAKPAVKTAAAKPAAAPAPAAPAAPPAPAVQSHSGVISGPMRPMTPPRAMAKAEIFVDGDFVVYPTHGVGKVERIATEEIAGHKLELIHITFDENRMTLRVPTNKARTAGLRKLASRKQFDEVLATLKGRARIKRTMWSRRAQEYEAKINSGDPSAIAEVVRDLHRNAGQPDQSFSERQIYESALDRLAAEYAALEQVDKPTAVERLIAHLKSD